MRQGKVNVFRYDPETDPHPRYETYTYPFEAGMTVLDVANYIYANVDRTFSFGFCCKNSHCGLCSAKINGSPGLMCREKATPRMTVEPLDPQAVIRDLLMDWSRYEGCMGSLRLFLDRVDFPEVLPEQVSREDHERFKVVSRCVRCYCCLSVCPPHKESPHDFLGPAAVVQLARHAFDPRDQSSREVMAHSLGLHRCILCGNCVEVCPHSISPEEAVRSLRERLTEKFPGKRKTAPRSLKKRPSRRRSGRSRTRGKNR